MLNLIVVAFFQAAAPAAAEATTPPPAVQAAPAPATATKKTRHRRGVNADGMICRDMPQTGSLRTQRVCRSAAQAEKEQDSAGEAMRRAQGMGGIGGGTQQ